MFRFSSPVTLRLEPGETLALRRGPRVRMAVQAGTVHLTRQDDVQDHFLQPGEAIDLDGSPRVVIESARADEPVLLRFTAPARGSLGAALACWAPHGAALSSVRTRPSRPSTRTTPQAVAGTVAAAGPDTA